jgi:energy-coupling factor transporter transmembrane protein EcfT
MKLALTILLFVALMIVAGCFTSRGLNLVLITMLMFLVMLILGKTITRRPLGILINERNLMSLSRFQMALWTLIALAAYFTYALARIRAGTPDPLNVQMDWHLWALMGISTTSLVGSPLILTTKKDKDPDPAALQRAARLNAEPAAEIDANREGTLYGNASLADACFTDMFQGDEINNTTHIDLAKVQMFYFTIISAVAFFVMVFSTLASPTPELGQLPLLPDGLVAVLGISNAGYLTSKTISHTQEAS